MTEPVADPSTAYTKCNGLTLPSDVKNTSSFSFAALEWANNIFQNWTADPKISAVAGGNNGILSSPSKTTSGRKKTVLLVVNKPDTFTTGELTYLGLSNDADEQRVDLDWKETTMPSSKRWQSVCYGGGKFVAIIFSRSNVVAYSSNGINWSQSTLPLSQWWSSVCYGGGKFVAVADTSGNTGATTSDVAAYSSDGINWTQSTLPSKQDWWPACYGDGKFVAVVDDSNKAAYGEFTVKTNTVGNKALKDALDDGAASGVTTLTTNACNKLKETYGDDIRIDIVKYKASGTDDDYQYLKDCAENTGGKLHSAEDETSLKSTLDTIAADLKSWAGYKDARVVN